MGALRATMSIIKWRIKPTGMFILFLAKFEARILN